LLSTKTGALLGLDVAVRSSEKTEGRESIPGVVNAWVEEMRRSGFLSRQEIEMTAGASLLNLGFNDQGLEYIEKAFLKSPDLLPQYIAALLRTDRLDDALDVCMQHVKTSADASSASLLIDLFIRRGDGTLSSEEQQVIQTTVDQFPNDARLLDSFGTLRLQQEDFQQAIAIYERVLKLDPVRIRSLNNLAMALSEFPARAADGIPVINRAIRIAGEHPELLDTKGVVLLKAGQLEEAAKVFQKAFENSQEPRFLFHLIVTRLAQNKIEEAKKLWGSLDLEKLDPSGLTPGERTQLESMKKDFGTNSSRTDP
jgi:tetratricopeptide (TPR) repeat protein